MKIPRQSFQARRALVLAAAIVGGSVTPVFAQASIQSVPVTAGDRAFVTNMLQISREQLALAALAGRRTSGAEAGTAAQQATVEWSSLRARLMPIAYAQGAPIRGTLNSRQQGVLRRLGRTPTGRFSGSYLRDAQHGNEVALAQLRQEANTTDPQVQRFIAFARPIVSSNEQTTSDDTMDNHL